MRSFIAPLTKQLEDLTGFFHRLSVKSHPNNHTRVETNANKACMDARPTCWQKLVDPQIEDNNQWLTQTFKMKPRILSPAEDYLRQPLTPKVAHQYEDMLNAITTLPVWLQTHNIEFMSTQVPMFGRKIDIFNEFDFNTCYNTTCDQCVTE